MALPQDGLLAKANKPSKPSYEATDADPVYRQSDWPQGTQEATYGLVEVLMNEIRAATVEISAQNVETRNLLSSIDEKLDKLIGAGTP